MSRAVQLQAYLDTRPGHPFDWQFGNCCHFVCDWVECVTGAHPMAGLRKTRTEGEAQELVSELGGSLIAAFTKCSLLTEIDGRLAQLGDIVYVPLKDGNGCLGICAGRDALFVDSYGEIRRLAVKHATCAWKI